jgi:hypothetical protein
MDYNNLSDLYPHLECDGFSQVLANTMSKQGLKPRIKYGAVKWQNQSMSYHEWIECEGQIYDFRLRMWFGSDAPHGIIEKSHKVKYLVCGEKMPLTYNIIKILIIN